VEGVAPSSIKAGIRECGWRCEEHRNVQTPWNNEAFPLKDEGEEVYSESTSASLLPWLFGPRMPTERPTISAFSLVRRSTITRHLFYFLRITPRMFFTWLPMPFQSEHAPCCGQLTMQHPPEFTEVEMDVLVTEEQIRTLAFYLWEKDGGPEGRSEEYRESARKQLLVDVSPAASEGGHSEVASA
jgi:hypothetical protein